MYNVGNGTISFSYAQAALLKARSWHDKPVQPSRHRHVPSRQSPRLLQFKGQASGIAMRREQLSLHVSSCGTVWGGTSNSYRNWHWRQVEDKQSPRHPSRKSRPFPSSAWQCCVAWQVPRFLQLVLAKASEHCISTYYNQVSVYLRVGDTLDAKYEVPHARTLLLEAELQKAAFHSSCPKAVYRFNNASSILLPVRFLVLLRAKLVLASFQKGCKWTLRLKQLWAVLELSKYCHSICVKIP